ncbi:MAG: type II toxin-antitoxin system PemK/MazF family toxin [Bacteroidetes bacterium]|nr:type II toxin-antitoxin system PemK/MazF family toxin [Bacteroidota bacterium]
MTNSKSAIYQFGDIVLLAFPFTNAQQKKKRPALVLFESGNQDFTLCRITSHEKETEFDYFINKWENHGLLLPSVIRLNKIATLENILIEKKLGKLSKKQMTEVKSMLVSLMKNSLKIS